MTADGIFEAYRTELEELRFSEDAKTRMVARISAKVTSGVEALTMPSAAVASADTVLRGPRRLNLAGLVARAAVVAVVALVLGAGTMVAYASGTLEVALGAIGDVFTGAPAPIEVVNRVGHPIGATATSAGVRITAEAVLGDCSTYTMIFRVEKEDGSRFEGISANEDGLLDVHFSGDTTARIDGIKGAGGTSWFYDADVDDNAIQYVCQGGMAADESAVGRTARVHLSNLTVGDGDDARVIAAGSWDFKFEMGYEDTTVELGAGEQVAFGDYSATISGVYVSSLGVTVDYLVSDEEMTISKARECTIMVEFTNGDVFDATNANIYLERRGSETFVRHTRTFDRIVDMSDIASVTVGNLTVPVS